MVHTRSLAFASLAIILLHGGCASNPDASTVHETGDARAAFDPLDGNYPQIMWMCNVYEVPALTEIAADGTVRPSTSAKPNGVGVIDHANTDSAFASIRELPNATNLGTPVSFSAPKSPARVEPGSRDKAGSSIGDRSVTLKGELVGDRIKTSVEIAASRGAFQTSCHCGQHEVPPGGALLFLCPGPDSREPWTLLIVRPTVLRSKADFPYQRASSFATSATP